MLFRSGRHARIDHVVDGDTVALTTGARVRLVQIDTPEVLRTHATSLGADPRLWSFVTGDRDEIDKWASGFGLSVSRATNDPRDITHNLRTALLDRQGNLVQIYTGNEWTPEQVLADVRVMVGVD